MADDFSRVSVRGSALGNSLQSLLMCDDIEPGADAGYQICKTLFVAHPLGGKMVETPVKLAQDKPREVVVDGAPGNHARDAFEAEWALREADQYIYRTRVLSRIYGAAALLLGFVDEVGAGKDEARQRPLDPWSLPDREVFLNALDPLNASGSLVLDQNPNSPTFQRVGNYVTSNGVRYHASRACVKFNGQPIYIAYNPAAFGFSGWSVYQRALFPLKSFVQTMVTDDMVSRKAGLIVAILKSTGAIVNRLVQLAAGIKRRLLREAGTDNVLSIEVDEKIESINMENIDKAMVTARGNIVKNIATAGDMPAQILEQESFAEGFGEGTEDTKNLARFVEGERREMGTLYDFLTMVCQHRAWSLAFFEAQQGLYPEVYGGMEYKQAFYMWRRGFKATWPSLLEEPESEKAKLDKVKLEGLIAVYQELGAGVDPENKQRLTAWLMDNVNEYKHLFPVGLDLDLDVLLDWYEERQEKADKKPEEQPPGTETGKPALSLVR